MLSCFFSKFGTLTSSPSFFFNSSWAADRLIEAGFHQAQALKNETEQEPSEEKCKLAIQLIDATAAAIGWGVGCHAKVGKSRILADRNTLIRDMAMVYNNTAFDPKKLQKLPLKTLLGANDPESETEWMGSTDWITNKKVIAV